MARIPKKSLIDDFKKEYRELFEERQTTKVKNSVFRIMGELDEIEEQLDSLKLQKDLLDERKEKLQKELKDLE